MLLHEVRTGRTLIGWPYRASKCSCLSYSVTMPLVTVTRAIAVAHAATVTSGSMANGDDSEINVIAAPFFSQFWSKRAC